MPKNKKYEIEKVSPDRDAVLGDQYNLFILKMGSFTPPTDLAELRHDYLAYLQRNFHALDFKGIPQLRSLPSELALEEVYVPLLARPEQPEGETWERRLAGRAFERDSLPAKTLRFLGQGKSSAPVQIEEALREKTRVVVLGDPGSGKSTMLKYLALRMARDPQAPLPILLPLNAYARTLERKEVNLQVYLAEYVAGRAQGMATLRELFDQAIREGKTVILLDGLDEVQSDRAALVHNVETFAGDATLRGNRVLVTSRIVGYRDAPLAPKDWALHTLLDFDVNAITAFAGKWCLAFEKSILGDTPEAENAAEIERQTLLEAIRANPGVGRLASNPLLLTILALIKRQGVELPRSRIKLYDRYLETLIEAWNRASALDKSAGRASLDYESTLEVLGPLALRIRQENPTAGLVGGHQLQDWLTEYYTSEQWGFKPGPAREKAREFLENVRRYSNLLVERGEGQFGFTHLTFEEALAAYGLVAAGQINRQNSLDYIQRYLADPGWRETILLSVGVLGLLQRQPLAAGEVVRAMLKMDCTADQACQNVLLAGACLEDVGETGLGRAAASQVIAALHQAALNRALPPPTQRDAGFILGRLAGNSPEFLQRIRPDLDEFVLIPAGRYRYGGDDFPERDELIAEPFTVARYPVTNLQYRRFVEAGGYEAERWWSADGWAWRMGQWDSKAPEGYREWLAGRPPEKRGEPFYWHDIKWNNPLAPVVGVSWFEAQAYCAWFSAQPGNRPVRLPAEGEWEHAARGAPGREYAWGDDFDRDKLNCAEFWAMQADLSDDTNWINWFQSDSRKDASTTIVGQFPSGATPDGIHDLSGNVWEWTASWFETEQVNRVLRGGSWSNVRRNARCAYRSRYVPDLFDNNIGFRILSPGIFPDSAC